MHIRLRAMEEVETKRNGLRGRRMRADASDCEKTACDLKEATKERGSGRRREGVESAAEFVEDRD